MEGQYLLACFPWLAQKPFLQVQAQLPSHDTLHGWPGIPTQLPIKKILPNMVMDWSKVENSPIEILTLGLCQIHS